MAQEFRSITYIAEQKVGKVLITASRWLAYFGGFVISAAALMTVISIIGRKLSWLGLGPIHGDFELVNIACAIAVFSFLPWCQMNSGHVCVDILASRFSNRAHSFLIFLGDLALSIVSVVILWRLWLGFGERFPYGSDTMRTILGLGSKPFYAETTFILQMPIWYGYAASILGAILFSIVSIYCTVTSLKQLLSNHEKYA